MKLETVMDKICEEYCKYTPEYKKRYTDQDEAWERLCIERCVDCPLLCMVQDEYKEDDDLK